MTKAMQAVIIEEIKTELDKIRRRQAHNPHETHLISTIEYYKPSKPFMSKKKSANNLSGKIGSSMNILIKTVSESSPMRNKANFLDMV